MLIYDGHVSHVDERLILCAINNGVTILKLPPHSSHVLQPLDISVFRLLKTRWDTEVVQWQRHSQGQRIPKKHISKLIGKVWFETSSDIIANGFRKGGIFPFNSKVISDEKYDPLALKRWESSQNIPNRNLNEPENNMPGPSNVDENRHAPSSEIVSQSKTSFEELLLDMVKQHKGTEAKKPKRRVASGAEIITAPEALKRLEERNNEKLSKKRKRCGVRQESDLSSEEVLYEDSDDDIDKELTRVQEEREYMDRLNKIVDSKIDDWVLVVCAGKKLLNIISAK